MKELDVFRYLKKYRAVIACGSVLAGIAFNGRGGKAYLNVAVPFFLNISIAKLTALSSQIQKLGF